jgi:hypothetical protein
MSNKNAFQYVTPVWSPFEQLNLGSIINIYAVFVSAGLHTFFTFLHPIRTLLRDLYHIRVLKTKSILFFRSTGSWPPPVPNPDCLGCPSCGVGCRKPAWPGPKGPRGYRPTSSGWPLLRQGRQETLKRKILTDRHPFLIFLFCPNSCGVEIQTRANCYVFFTLRVTRWVFEKSPKM